MPRKIESQTAVSPRAGAALSFDFDDMSKGDALALGSVVVGAGVVGTSMLIAAYAAPAPIIGGAAIGVGLGIASSMIEDAVEEKTKSDKKSASEVTTVSDDSPIDSDGNVLTVADL